MTLHNPNYFNSPNKIRAKHLIGKKASLKTLKRYCLGVWANLVKIRDNNRCILCGESFRLQAHHIITRKFAPTRFVVNCGVTLCPGCHSFRLVSAHTSPWVIYEWIQRNRPEQYKWFLENKDALHNPPEMKLNIIFYRETLANLMKELERVAPDEFRSNKFNTFLTEEENKICNDYTNNLLSMRDLARKYKTNKQVIHTILQRYNVKLRENGAPNKKFMKKKYKLNYDNIPNHNS